MHAIAREDCRDLKIRDGLALDAPAPQEEVSSENSAAQRSHSARLGNSGRSAGALYAKDMKGEIGGSVTVRRLVPILNRHSRLIIESKASRQIGPGGPVIVR